MESKFMKPGEDAVLIKGLENKWRWAWTKEMGKEVIFLVADART